MCVVDDWSWPDHPFKYRIRTFFHYNKKLQVTEWVEENINLANCLTFDGQFGDCYFKNGEDAMAFKLRWL